MNRPAYAEARTALRESRSRLIEVRDFVTASEYGAVVEGEPTVADIPHRFVPLFGDRDVMIAAVPEIRGSNGSYIIAAHRAGAVVPVHTHSHMDAVRGKSEEFIMIDGEMDFVCNGEVTRYRSGDHWTVGPDDEHGGTAVRDSIYIAKIIPPMKTVRTNNG